MDEENEPKPEEVKPFGWLAGVVALGTLFGFVAAQNNPLWLKNDSGNMLLGLLGIGFAGGVSFFLMQFPKLAKWGGVIGFITAFILFWYTKNRYDYTLKKSLKEHSATVKPTSYLTQSRERRVEAKFIFSVDGKVYSAEKVLSDEEYLRIDEAQIRYSLSDPEINEVVIPE